MDASFFISIPAQAEDRDGFRLRVDDPVFWDMGLGIVPPLVNQIPFRFLFANNFQSEVGAEPEPVLPARIGRRKQQKKIGLAELAQPNLQPQRRKADLPALR